MTREEQIEKAKAELFPIGDNGRNYEQALSASGFDLGVMWADEHPRKGLVDIDRMCEWLDKNMDKYATWSDYINPDIVEDIKQAMKDESK